MIRATGALVLGVLLCAGVAADETRHGIVKQEPEDDYVYWFIGGEQLDMAEGASIKDKVGPLEVGACAELDIADGVIQSAKTRPMSDCDLTDYDAYLAGFMSLMPAGS